MKRNFILIALIGTLFSCSSYNRIITINDDYKNEESIRLIQTLKGYSDEKRGRIFGADYPVTLKTVYSKPEDKKGQVTAELTVKTEARPEDLDSLVFMELDNKKYKFLSNEYATRLYVNHSTSTSTTTSVEKAEEGEEKKDAGKTSTTTQTTTSDQTLQVMKRTVEIPRDVWRQLSQLDQVKFRFYIDNEGVTVRFNSRDRKKFAALFEAVLVFEKRPDREKTQQLR